MSFFFRHRQFSVHPKEIVGNVGDAVKLTVNRRAQFYSHKPDVTTVDSSGQVRLVGAGTDVITVDCLEDGIEPQFVRVTVTVRATGGVITEPIGWAQPPPPSTLTLEQRVKALEERMGKHEGAMHP